MNEQQLKALQAIGGEGFARMVQEAGERTTKELEGMVDFKSAADADQDNESEKMSHGDRVRAVMEKIDDAKLKERIEAFLGKMATEMGEKEGEPLSESDKANTYEKLGNELKMIAGQVGGDEGKELAAVAEDLIKMGDGKKGTDAEPTEPAQEPEPPAAEPAQEPATEQEPEPVEAAKDAEPAPAEEPFTREEIAEGFKGMVAITEEMIAESGKALVAALKSIVTEAVKEAVEPLKADIEALQATDAEKIAQKAVDTPAASLQAIMESARKSASTRILPTNPLMKGVPPEAEPGEKGHPRGGRTGIGFIDTFIEGADQKQ